MAEEGAAPWRRTAHAEVHTGYRPAAQFDTEAGASSLSLGQWPRPPAVRLGLRALDATSSGGSDREEVRSQVWRNGGWRTSCPFGIDATETSSTGLSARPGSH